jgi:hypothetical protein
MDLSTTPSEHSRLTDGYDPIGIEPLEVRLAMLANGYEPIPLNGKRPLLNSWQQIPLSEDVARGWGGMGPNTGMRTTSAPALDADIQDADGARVVRGALQQLLGGKGKILERIGHHPKFAVILRTNAPFKKIIRKLQTPDGRVHKIEVLADGQQIAVAGIHPDTKEPFRWRGGLSPVNTPRSELPLVDENEVDAILDLCVEELKTRLGWREIDAAPAGVIDALRQPTVHGRLQNMSPGVDVNDALFRAVGSRLWSGIPMEDVVAEMVDAAMAKAPSPDWTPEAQRFEIEDMCLRTILKDPKLYPLLTDKYRQQLERLQADGYRSFMVSGNRYGPYIRSAGSKDIPTVESPCIAPGERKLRFRLIRFQDMRPGLEPTYLVDELMPTAGLVLVWGKQKTFKSFWLLDLFVHVAMGWPYRDHAVRQGAVIYCAFEGGHGYKGRIEAIRRHYGIANDMDVPLYVMPGQVDLIADEKALVEEFRYQLGTVVPAVVVLDTLNRSLSGSESSDKDMTLYVKAAEAVRKAFGCLCVIVHHCGYDDTHARGHTSLPAAVDAELSVMRDEGSPVVLVTVKAMRDGPEGMVVRSRALPVPLDPDQNGKPRSSIVIVPDDDSTVVVPAKQGWRRDTATPLLVEVLRAALDTKGECFTPDGKLPLQAADSQQVRELFYRRYVDVEEDEHKSRGAQKQAYKRGVEGAIAKQIVNGQKDDQGRQLLWFVRDEGEAL